MQLTFTALFVTIICSSQKYKLFVKTHIGLYFLMVIINIATLITLACFQSIARNVPINYILLAVFTFS